MRANGLAPLPGIGIFPIMTIASQPDFHTFEHHWQDEADAAFLYRALADVETDSKKQDVYRRLAAVEDRHVEIWARLLTEHGHPPPPFRPTSRARLLAWLGRRFGPGFLLPHLLREEGREVKGYLDLHQRTPSGAPGGGEALLLARESAEHGRDGRVVREARDVVGELLDRLMQLSQDLHVR